MEVGVWSCIAICTLFGVFKAASMATDMWLSKWMSDDILANITVTLNNSMYWETNEYYIGVYAAFGCIQGKRKPSSHISRPVVPADMHSITFDNILSTFTYIFSAMFMHVYETKSEEHLIYFITKLRSCCSEWIGGMWGN